MPDGPGVWPLSPSLSPAIREGERWVGVPAVSARFAWVTYIPMVMPLGMSAVVLLWQKAKSLPLKPSSLLSPATNFSTYSSGFGIDLNREGRWGGGEDLGNQRQTEERRGEEEEPKAWWVGREEGQPGREELKEKSSRQQGSQRIKRKGVKVGNAASLVASGDPSQTTPPPVSWRELPSWDPCGAQHPIPGRIQQGRASRGSWSWQ